MRNLRDSSHDDMIPMPGEDLYPGTDSIESPEEGDYTSHDGGHSWSQYGKVVLPWADDTGQAESRLRRHADKEKFWPAAWLISDHGNEIPFKYHI